MRPVRNLLLSDKKKFLKFDSSTGPENLLFFDIIFVDIILPNNLLLK